MRKCGACVGVACVFGGAASHTVAAAAGGAGAEAGWRLKAQLRFSPCQIGTMSANALLLWTLLLASARGSVSHGPGLNSGQDYEVVRPLRLHTISKRHAEQPRPQTVKYALTVRGRPLELHLERNESCPWYHPTPVKHHQREPHPEVRAGLNTVTRNTSPVSR